MKFSCHWLAELVDGLDTPPAELARLITMKTAECEGVTSVGERLAEASPARVLAVEPLGASHNRKAVVETPRYGTRTVACGAANCRPGLMTVYLPAERKVIEGVESDGMLASGKELGINDDHEGIVELDADFPFVPDAVIEVDNKSLTHRPDLWGHLGMAREAAAILGKRVTDPVRLDLLPRGKPAIDVAIEDFDLCPRYSALVFENVTVQPSPLWLQYRLHAVGLNPINNVVDVTNFVLAELAQPMHAFDADRLEGGILVRPGRPGERVPALNGETYAVDESTLLITDAGGPVAIAGVIGGGPSAISASTTRIVLESANFQAASIRRTSSRLKLRTDASMRFEKSQDPANTVRGLARAIALLEEVSPGIRLAGGLADVHRPFLPPPSIALSLDWLDRKLGKPIPLEEVLAILKALQFGVTEVEARHLLVTVPGWRATKDVSIPDDLVEEIGRMVGYSSIPPRPPLTPAVVPPGNPEREFHHAVRDLAAANGYDEVYNYSFFTDAMLEAFAIDRASLVEVANPIAAGQNYLRSSLLPGVWKNVSDNARHLAAFRFFEIGKEIHKREGTLPEERTHFVAVVYAREGDGAAGLFELKRIAEMLAPGVAVDMSAEALGHEHPHRKCLLRCGGRPIGRLFEFHPRLVETGRAAVLDLDLDALREIPRDAPKYQPLRRFPTSSFDLSIVVPERTLTGDLDGALRQLAGADLVSLEYLRTFPLPGGRKSVSFRLTAGAADRTLSNDEVMAVRERVIEGLRSRGFELR
jgi:phenylalanyl-tRNA synthetase beta chain